MWLPHNHSDLTEKVGKRIADLVGFPLKNAESFQIVYYTGGTQYNDHHDAFNADTDEGKKIVSQTEYEIEKKYSFFSFRDALLSTHNSNPAIASLSL